MCIRDSNIANDSMASGALVENGILSVEEGKWYLLVEFKTLSLMGLEGNASNIKYYESDTNSSKYDATVLSYRNDSNGNQQVEKVKIPVAIDSSGVYLSLIHIFYNTIYFSSWTRVIRCFTHC